MKTLNKKDNMVIIFGNWFDRTHGNTYFDAHIILNDNNYYLGSQYGYHAGSQQSVEEVLEKLGYKIRKGKKYYEYISIVVTTKKHKELFKKDVV